MRKWLVLLLAVVMVLCMVTTSFAVTAAEQVAIRGGTIYYDATGNEVTGENVQFPGGHAVVELSKTVASTGTENEFEVELKVRTTQNILELHSDTPDAAVMLILDVSNSMDDCDTCGKEYSDHNSGNSKQHYVSRLAKAKTAAIQFLRDFAATKEEANDKRWVSIVDFGSTAYRRQVWVDVAAEGGLTQAVAVINSLTVAHSDLNGRNGKPDVDDDGGTNIEGALMLGANIWENKDGDMNSTTAAAIKALDYKYTILLTDGQPTYHVTNTRNSTTQIGGSQGGGSYTTVADAKDVGTQADRILGLSSLSKLYSICYGSITSNGSTTYVANDTPFENWDWEDHSSVTPRTKDDMTILEWLDAFSTDAFNGATQGEYDLFDTFNSIISQIQLATQAWKVDDPMGAHVVWGGEVQQSHDNKSSFDTATNTLHWDVLASDYSGFDDDETNPVLTYTYKYKITLDNLDTNYDADNSANTNNNANLTYAVKQNDGLWNKVDPVEFPEPAVKGFAGTLTFTKGWLDKEVFKSLAGVKFTLTSKDKSAEGVHWTQTVESGADGTVTFNDIPSGHDYTLTESNLTIGENNFANLGSMDVSVNWGETTFSKLNNQNQLINHLAEKEVELKLEKKFGNDNKPESIDFTIVLEGTNETYNVTLSGDNGWTATLDGLTPGTYVITEDAAWEGYDLTNQTVTWTSNGNLSFGQYGNVRVPLTVAGNNSTASYTVTFTNTYTQQVGKVSVAKTFLERKHDELIGGGSGDMEFEKMDESLLAAMEIEIDLVDADGTAVETITLTSNNWSVSNISLPVGEYTIVENVKSGVIQDHDFVHLHVKVTVDGKSSEGNKFTVGKGSVIALELENHYTHHVGDIRVEKLFEGIDAADVPEDTKFYVDVYASQADADANQNSVATITVEKLEGGEWVGTSVDLPVGQYYLKEQTTNINGYDFVSGVFDVGDTVTVRHGEQTNTTTVGLTNTYKKQMGELTVKKNFAFATKADEEGFTYPTSIIVNVLDGGASGDVVATLELKAGNTPAWTASVDLPLGNYYLSEVTGVGVTGTADVKDYGMTATWSSTGVTITNNGNVTREVTNTYTKNKGSLTISKTFAGVPQEIINDKTVNFVIYQKDASGNNKEVDTVVLTNGVWSKTVDLPVGTYYVYEYGARNSFDNYTLTEVKFKEGETKETVWYKTGMDMAGITGYEVNITNSATITLAATNTYKQDVANITVTKKFGDGSAWDENTFGGPIDVLVYSGNSVVKKLTLNKENNWTATAEKLPAGQEYTLVEVVRSLRATETDADLNTAYRDGYDLVHVWSGDNEFILEKDKDVALTVTNTYTKKTGELILHKIFDRIEDEDVALLDNVSIALTIVGEGKNETITLDKSNNWYSDKITLPVGTYTLEEAAISLNGYTHKDATFASVSGQVTDNGAAAKTATVEIKADQIAPVTIVVTNTMERQLGSLTISKAFDEASELSEAYFADKKIDILVKHEGTLYQTVTLPTETGAWSVTLTDVPTGAYTVEEVISGTAPNTAHVNGYGLHVGYTNNNNTVAVETNQTAAMVITNKYTQHVGYIRVKKVFSDDDNSQAAEEFIPNSGIAIHLYDADGNWEETGYVSRENGGVYVFKELPVGTYKLVEETHEGAEGTAHVNGYDLTVTYSAENVEVTTDHTVTAPLDVTVTNTYTKTFGNLTVKKAFVDCQICGAVRPMQISVTLQKSTPATEGEIPVWTDLETVQLNANNNWAYTWHELPVGIYRAVENEQSAKVAYHTLSVENTGELEVDGTERTGTIKNTYTHDTGSLTISKVFAQGSALNENYFATKKINILVKYPGAEDRIVPLPTADGKWEVTLTNLPAGDYTVEEVIADNADNTAHVAGYGLTVTYNGAALGRVQVVKGDTPAAMVVSNKYTDLAGELTIKKAFAQGSALGANSFSVINVDILHKNGTLFRQIVLEAAKDWTWTGTLPVGEYIVREVTEPGVTGSAYRSEYHLNVEYSDEAKTGSINVTGAAPAEITITNHYTYVPVVTTGSLMITKAFQGPEYLYPASVEFTVTGPGVSQTLTLSAANNWTAVLGDLSAGEYTVTESVAGGSSYAVSTFWSSPNGKIMVYPGQTATLTCTNVYQEHQTLSIRIPVEKTVILGGDLVPSDVSRFSFGAAWQGSNNVTVRFENAADNTQGTLLQTSANTYAATVQEDGTVKGYIVIEGYAHDLAGFKLQTWEKLTGYASAEEAMAAGWTFDKTATDGTVVWNIQLDHDGNGSIVANVARTDGQAAGQVRFENVYTSIYIPPQTGDGENLALWTALCVLCVLGAAVLLMHHKKTSVFMK